MTWKRRSLLVVACEKMIDLIYILELCCEENSLLTEVVRAALGKAERLGSSMDAI